MTPKQLEDELADTTTRLLTCVAACMSPDNHLKIRFMYSCYYQISTLFSHKCMFILKCNGFRH